MKIKITKRKVYLDHIDDYINPIDCGVCLCVRWGVRKENCTYVYVSVSPQKIKNKKLVPRVKWISII